MGAILILALAGWSVQGQEADDLDALQESVQTLSSKDHYDRALEALNRFASAHPSLAEDFRFKTLLRKTQSLAQEADRLFKDRLAKAEEALRQGQFAQAIGGASSALQLCPDRQAPVKELQERAREPLVGKDMVRIPSLSAWIGSDEHPDEKPLREVKLPAFLMDKYPVTAENYAAFVAMTGAAVPSYWQHGKPPKGKEDLPVVYVPYDDAVAFAKWAGKRLPTAEEWEVAARGSDRREFPWGNSFLEAEGRFPANCLDYWQVHRTLSPGPTPVRMFFDKGFVSAAGVSMGGNVWEWTSTGTPGKVGEQAIEFRVLKGGSFMTPARSLRCAVVLPENPKLVHPDTGFRCVKDIRE